MSKSILTSLFLALTTSLLAQQLTSYVNPFIGTGGHGHTYPGASMPFGMMQLSPDTRLTGWDGCSGYHYTDNIVYGFSHTHLSGTGVSDYGDILFTPFNNRSHQRPNKRNNPPVQGNPIKEPAQFNKETEAASPGFYHMDYLNNEVSIDLTCTQRAGMHRYTFKDELGNNIAINLAHRDKVLSSELNIESNNTISGKRISSAWAKEQHVYFVAEFSEPFEVNTAFRGMTDSLYTVLKFQKKQVLVRVGISAVSVEGARKNLQAEISDWDFEKVRTEAQTIWEKELSKIVVEGTADQKEIFYTSLYHSLLNPNLFSDVDGKYRGTDLNVHETNQNIYTVFSLWDTYRATHPLFTIIDQKRTNEFVNTFLLQYTNGGKLPMWELSANYTGCMIGYHAVPVIADAYMKNIRDYDVNKAFQACLDASNADELGKPYYINNGYIAATAEHESVSKALEYSYNDWCIAQMAKELNSAEATKYTQRGQYYKNHFDPRTGFMRAKRNQTFMEPFDPTEVNFNFTEANSWQYSFYAPQDVSGLIQLMGGKENFSSKLDELFTTSSETSGREQVDITGLVGQYAHGNEPSHHMAYLYNYVNEPWKTQKMVRHLLDEMYTTKPDGLIGNEDCGQMSSWYVLSAMGFYPVTPGETFYAIGSPNLQSAQINLENGKQLVITANNQTKENIYIQSMTLNGQPHTNSYISHFDIMKGGELVFEMGPNPNENWGNSDSNVPVSGITKNLITPVPFFSSPAQAFEESMKIEMSCADKGAKIYFTLDGTTPSTSSAVYSKPVAIDQKTTVKAIALADGKAKSFPVEAEYFKISGKRTIQINSTVNSQYTAGGPNALLDGIRGGNDFRTGAWHGYQGTDFEAIVDLGEVKDITKISSGYIQDLRSWIIMPQNIIYEVSEDGVTYETVALIKQDYPADSYVVSTRDFPADVNTKGRYIKVSATYFGKLPDFHEGAGGESYIFIDEIMIE